MFEVYRDDREGKREWRWRLVAANGKIVADSGEGYVKRSAVIAAVKRLKALVPEAGVVERLN